MTTRKDKDEASAAEPQVTLQKAGPAVPVLAGDGVGQEDEKVNPAQDELQETVDTAESRGYYGVEADKTPDHHYSVTGVLAGLPTPETTKGEVA